MGFKEKMKGWKEKRKAKKEAKRDLYDVEEERLKKDLESVKSGTDEYSKLQEQIKTTIANRSESRESKRLISKSDKGGIIKVVAGGLITLAGMLTVAKFEKDGLTYTGEKRSIMDTLIRTIGRFLPLGGG